MPNASYVIRTLDLSFQKLLEVRMRYQSPRNSMASSSKGAVSELFVGGSIEGERNIAVDDMVMD